MSHITLKQIDKAIRIVAKLQKDPYDGQARIDLIELNKQLKKQKESTK